MRKTYFFNLGKRMGVIINDGNLRPLDVWLANGIRFGWSWVHCGGESSKTSAVLASCHPPDSITWTWSLTWQRTTPKSKFFHMEHRDKFGSQGPNYGISLPPVGYFHLSQQDRMPYNR